MADSRVVTGQRSEKRHRFSFIASSLRPLPSLPAPTSDDDTIWESEAVSLFWEAILQE